jgi:BRCA1-associated protein
MFIKSIVFQTPSEQAIGSFPDTSQDPFTPSLGVATDPGVGASLALKPFPPPTPSLVELPTCPVCLERMDDTTGLLTILCQHVFHCACLTKWRGSGCPVCRHTQPQPSLTQPFGTSASDLCRVCDCSEDLWICLICGHVGCGRYKGGHAKEHWKETAHNYALEIETQHVWDYAGDLWVHRLIQTKGDGKLVELPSNSRPSNGFGGSREDREDEDVEMVPRAKLENIGMEYTNLLTSQLESQRAYYEDIVKKTVAKASAASKAAEAAAAKAEEAMSALKQLTIEHSRLRDVVVPSLEKEIERMRIKAEKSGELARAMTKSWQEEKKVGEGLMERIKHINESMVGLSKELTKAKEECEDLKEQNRDLGFFISGQEKLKEMEGQLGDEVTEGTVSLPERKEKDSKSKGKGKGRGK